MDNSARCLLICILILFSALFSATETALSYANRYRIRQLADTGSKRAKKADKLLSRFDDVIVAILVGNNIVNTLIASIGAFLFIDLMGDIGSLVSTVVITLAVFIFGETVPKTIAKVNCDSVTLAIAPFLAFYTKIVSPIALVFTKTTDFLKRKLIGKKEPALTDDDFCDIVENSEEEGVLEPEESEIIQGAVEFSDLTVESVYQPIEKVVSISLAEPRISLRDRLLEAHYSRVPVRRTDAEPFFGFLRAKEYLLALLRGEENDPQKYITPAYFVSPNTPLTEAFEQMTRKKSHMAFVRESDDSPIMGIVTMEDVLEELVGDIYDENDAVIGGGQEVKV